MTKFALIILASAFAFNAQAADQQTDSRYFQLATVKVTEVTEQYSAPMAQAGLLESCDKAEKPLVALTADMPSTGNPLDVIEVVVDRIINVGKKIWNIMDAGRPVVNVQSYTANALPQGLTCWSDLTGWSVPQSKVYKVSYRNGFGSEVVSFAYRVGFTGGGALNGQGKYITNANITPADLNVSWGFTLNAQGEVPSVFNMGTKEAPVAGMQMVMKWQVKSVMTEAQASEAFFVGGDSSMKHLE